MLALISWVLIVIQGLPVSLECRDLGVRSKDTAE
jgi:hypothetical protein